MEGEGHYRTLERHFSRARKVLFPVAPGVDRAAAHSLGLDLTSSFEASTPEADAKEEQQSSRTVLEHARRERHRSRNYVLSKFFRDSRPYLRPKPAKDPRRNFDCPNVKWCLKDFTAASQSPPKCGERGGVKCQLTPA